MIHRICQFPSLVCPVHKMNGSQRTGGLTKCGDASPSCYSSCCLPAGVNHYSPWHIVPNFQPSEYFLSSVQFKEVVIPPEQFVALWDHICPSVLTEYSLYRNIFNTSLYHELRKTLIREILSQHTCNIRCISDLSDNHPS